MKYTFLRPYVLPYNIVEVINRYIVRCITYQDMYIFAFNVMFFNINIIIN